MSDRFLRFYSPASFLDFLSYRAEYPSTLKPLIDHYMSKAFPTLSKAIIQSARVYGESLNYSAYIAAKEELDDDAAKGRKGRSLSEYKDRILTQFESTIGSAKSGPALLAQLGTIAGRLTHREIRPAAGEFMEAVLSGDISPDDAKHLITAFMRLSTYRSATPDALGSVQYEEDETETVETEQPTEN